MREITSNTDTTAESGVGAPLLDRQHQSIVGHMDDLYRRMSNGHGLSAVEDHFNDLLQYLRAHKRDEEELLRCVGYPELKEHREHHASLLSHLRDVGDLVAAQSPEAPDVLLALRDRFREHVMEEDQKYAAFLHALHSTVIF